MIPQTPGRAEGAGGPGAAEGHGQDQQPQHPEQRGT